MGKVKDRITILVIGALVWLIYMYEEEMARYAMYPLLSYRDHEIMALVPMLGILITVVWIVRLVIRLIKKQSDKSDVPFLAVLCLVLVLQCGYLHEQYQLVYTSTIVTIEKVDTFNEIITVRILGDDQVIELKSPDVINYLLETNGQQYGLSYTHHKNDNYHGTVDIIQLID